MTKDTQWAVLTPGYIVRVPLDARPGDPERGPDGRWYEIESTHAQIEHILRPEQDMLDLDL